MIRPCRPAPWGVAGVLSLLLAGCPEPPPSPDGTAADLAMAPVDDLQAPVDDLRAPGPDLRVQDLGPPPDLMPRVVVYVDKSNPGCMTGDGSMARPYCKVQQGVDLVQASGGGLVLVEGKGDTLGYQEQVQISGRGVTVRGVGNPTIYYSPDLDPVLISSGAAVIIEDLRISGGNRALRCSGDSDLIVRRATLDQSSSITIVASSCAITLDRVVVSASATASSLVGILGTSRYQITNSQFGIGSYGLALITFGDTTTGTFRFNTILGMATGRFGEMYIACGAGAARPIEDSIVFMSNTNGGMPHNQFRGNCALRNTVVGSRSSVADPGAIKLEPSLSGGALVDNPANQACCIDKGTATPAVPEDLSGTPRPQRGGWDIGAYELR